jgi:hypothetical protein
VDRYSVITSDLHRLLVAGLRRTAKQSGHFPNEANSVKSVHFSFPNDVDAAPQISNHIVVNTLGFSDGFRVFETGCAQSH